MKLLDWLTGYKPAPKGVNRQSTTALRKNFIAINRKTAPFTIRDGKPEGVDLVAEWKIVDARWYELFAKAGLQRVFKVLMKLDASNCEVRAVDQEWSVEWRAGIPTLALSASAFRGRRWEKSFDMTFAFKEDLSYGKVYEYRFDTAEIKTPLIDAAHRAGWGWRGVAFGKL
ncbi:hypothetical protein QO002_005099 [Pararhizobium capsulatum DSM 1112]|uniref:Uncharacterized protein n=1 Tax=Pararhizobium capsulatum DSM 1112 TaxID=1121113 RepID=A0ABU0BX94_9HYPH|nr:hypothetical protein [Pararhizobium capsulatum]MDQ0322893.1 hypothetical protein [Pararhizobium capsulatum DSM 1112]